MKESLITHGLPSLREEQEVIINYDVSLDEWHFFSDCPRLCRKREHIVEAKRKVYHQDNGQLILLEGIITGNVTLVKKRKLSEAHREKVLNNLQRN